VIFGGAWELLAVGNFRELLTGEVACTLLLRASVNKGAGAPIRTPAWLIAGPACLERYFHFLLAVHSDHSPEA
jgi:hypothetical protein